MCGRNSQSVRSLSSSPWRNTRWEKPSCKTKSEGENGNCLWSMRGDFISRSTSINVVRPKRTNILHSYECVDLMRQTRTSNDNASRQTLNDCWDAEWGVALSENGFQGDLRSSSKTRKHRGSMNAVCSHGTMLGEN